MGAARGLAARRAGQAGTSQPQQRQAARPLRATLPPALPPSLRLKRYLLRWMLLAVVGGRRESQCPVATCSVCMERLPPCRPRCKQPSSASWRQGAQIAWPMHRQQQPVEAWRSRGRQRLGQRPRQEWLERALVKWRQLACQHGRHPAAQAAQAPPAASPPALQASSSGRAGSWFTPSGSARPGWRRSMLLLRASRWRRPPRRDRRPGPPSSHEARPWGRQGQQPGQQEALGRHYHHGSSMPGTCPPQPPCISQPRRASASSAQRRGGRRWRGGAPSAPPRGGPLPRWPGTRLGPGSRARHSLSGQRLAELACGT